MSRTRRIYNKIRKSIRHSGRDDRFYHPYIQLCCGHCRRCKNPNTGRKEKLEKRREFINLLKREDD